MISLWISLAVLALSVAVVLTVAAKRMQLTHGGTWRQVSVVVGLVVLALLVSFSLYIHFGASTKLALYYKEKSQAKAVQAEIKKLKSPQQVIAQLKQTLQAHPDSARGWYLLGRLYMGMSHYAQAEQVMQKAYRLVNDNSQYSLGYAEAHFFNHHQNLSGKMQAILQQLLAKDPSNRGALNLLAVHAYVHKNYAQAITYWEKILPQFPAGSQDSQSLLAMIAKAQKHVAK